MAGTKITSALPVTSDRAAWTEDEAAVIEAAGLVFTHGYGERKGQKVLAPRPIVARFLHTCERTGLDPLAKQIYCIGRFGSDGLEWSIQTGIDGFRVVAERSGQYAGQDEPEWLTADGQWVQAFVKGIHGDHPLAARIRVYRHDWDRPMTGIATWDEYAQRKRNGELTAMWEQRGPGQLAKCAEALALRKAFPQDLSGVYTDEEMDAAFSRGQEQQGDAERVPARERSRVAQLAPAVVDGHDAVVVAEIVPEPAAEASEPPAQGSGEESQEEYEARVAAEFDAIADAAAAEETKP
jgi:phage recombination protein Bet